MTDNENEWSTDPDEMQAAVDQMTKEFNSLNHANNETVKVLHGRGVAIKPDQITARRQEFFIDAMFGPWGESVERLQFELGWQRRLKALLAEALNETAGQSIIVPKSNGSAGGLHLP